MAIEIKFLSNVIGFLRGAQDMNRELDGVGDTLADLLDRAEDTERAGRDLGDGLADGAREADTALDRLGRSGRDLGDDLRSGAREGESALDRLRQGFREVDAQAKRTGDTGRESFRDMSDNAQEFRNEATQNFSEFASSFNGDIQDMAGGVQGLTGGLAAALTPGLGIPIAAVGALAATFLQSWITSTEQAEERVSTMLQGMLEANSTFIQESMIRSETEAIANDTERWAQAQERQTESGVEMGTVLRAMAGDAQAIGVIREAERKQLEDQLELIRNSADSEQIKADKVDAANLKYQAATEWLGQIISSTDTAAARAGAVMQSWDSANTAAQRTRDTVAGIIRDLDRVGQGVSIPIRADTTGVEGALRGLQGRTISVNVAGQITRIGNQVW